MSKKKSEKDKDDSFDEKCPECGSKIITLWSGVKCSKCKWWFCY